MNLKLSFFPILGALFFVSCDTPIETDLTSSALIPLPQEISATNQVFPLNQNHQLVNNEATLTAIGEALSSSWETLTSFPVSTSYQGSIHLQFSEEEQFYHPEAYQLEITPKKIYLRGSTPESIYRAWKTLEQLLMLANVNNQAYLPTGMITDSPDYHYRSAMLDVARHFFSVEEVKRYIDQLALYKINYLHLHLSDDQGWRIEIKSWPKLTEIGGSSEVGGASGGFYTQEDYQDLVAYAAERYITIVPEIDMPGHTNAALASYQELNCNNKATELYEGMEVGFSTLCVDKAVTYQFIDDVIREIVAMTPGPYFHIGGDESHATPKEDYIVFINKVLPMVEKYGKIPMGWDEIQLGEITESTVVQYWAEAENALIAKQKGGKVLISPASYAYLDMQYDSLTPLGLHWAGYVNVKKGYDWTAEKLVDGIVKEDIVGIEAPLWSETITNTEDLEYLAFPRLPGYAEIGWTKPEKRNWEDYRKRLGEHGAIFEKLDINFYRSTLVEWKKLK